MRGFRVIGLVLLAFVCSGLTASAADAPRWKSWLCNPVVGHDWCRVSLSITRFDATGNGAVDVLAAAKTPPVDCFYVYPTVSEQKRGNSTLDVTAAERTAALTQAAQFDRVCRVFAPMYRQVPGGGGAFHPNWALEYQDVLAAWRDYIANHNDGRGVVLIGHSKGAYVLTELIQKEIERSLSERRLLVSAILLGGNVTVADGSDTGGSFTSVPACRRRTQTGCVVAYSSWARTPPRDAAFMNAGRGKHVLCVNPAAVGGGKAPVTPVFVWYASGGLANDPNPRPPTTFVAFPGLYSARCVEQGSRAWLLVERVTSARADPRPTVQEVGNPGWGLHFADVNVALGDLLELVRSQSKAWLAHR